MLKNESFSDIIGNINNILTEIFMLIIISFVRCFASKPTDVVYVVPIAISTDIMLSVYVRILLLDFVDYAYWTATSL